MAKKSFLWILFVIAFAGRNQARPIDSSRLQIIFKSVVGNDMLEIGKQYTNPHGEPFSVTNFKYYLSGFYLTEKETGKQVPLSNDYFLIEERKPESKIISLTVPTGNYDRIGFSIGVDSLHNVSGMQEGALDPVNGMFWTWNTGYIMTKLEGKSPLSKAPFTNITYHIGGFKTGENVLRNVALNLSESASIKSGKTSEITITANINAWFAGAHTIKIVEQAFFMNPGPVAVKIADNYAAMFSISSWIIAK